MFNKDHVYIIAEIGVNHNGSLDLAKKSIDAAKETGADAVKFQTFKTEKLTSKKAEMADYQKKNTGTAESQYDMLKRLELSYEEFVLIKKYCDEKEIDFLSTPFDEESALFLKEIGVEGFKIGSGDLNNIPLLRKIDLFGLPVLLSTGMSTMEEVKESLSCFVYSDVTVLHCTSNYPAAPNDINLKAMVTISEETGYPVGYSDHSLGHDVAVAAVALGAEVIEKHFTLDKKLPGPDHQASLDPKEFADFVSHVRTAELFLGDGNKRVMPSERSTEKVAKKSLVVNHDLTAGHILQEGDLSIKRPGTGLPPKHLYQVIGKKLVHELPAEAVLTAGDLE